MQNEEKEQNTQLLENELEITDNLIEELKQEILKKEQEVLHIKKHGMKDTIISIIKARIK